MHESGWDDDLENQSDRVLDDLCAREVLRWRVCETDTEGVSVAYEAPVGYGRDIGCRHYAAKHWQPTRSWNDLGLVIAAIGKLGWVVVMEAGPEHSTAQVQMPLRPGVTVGLGEASTARQLHRAVVLACIRHVREVKEGWAQNPISPN